jgi:hypothetical protein
MNESWPKASYNIVRLRNRFVNAYANANVNANYIEVAKKKYRLRQRSCFLNSLFYILIYYGMRSFTVPSDRSLALRKGLLQCYMYTTAWTSLILWLDEDPKTPKEYHTVNITRYIILVTKKDFYETWNEYT